MFNSALLKVAQNLHLSDHYLLTLEFLFINYTARLTNYYSGCISEDTVENFKEMIPSAITSMPYPKIIESYLKCSPSQLHLADFTLGCLCSSLKTSQETSSMVYPYPIPSRLLKTFYFSTPLLYRIVLSFVTCFMPQSFKLYLHCS